MQNIRRLFIGTLALFVLNFVVSCHDKDNEGSTSPVLRIYVFAPNNPIYTRANTGDVAATAAEKTIHSLQIWVFEHESANLVGYINPTSDEVTLLNTNGQDSYLLPVSRTFANTKPSVDVYVLANCSAANCGSTYGANTTRAELDAAQIAHGTDSDNFGLTTLRTTVDENEGLPMSGVLKEQPIYGESPVLRIGTSEKLATVRLVRAISKVRFVFSSKEADDLKILSVSLDGNVIPKAQHLLLDVPYATGREFRIYPQTGRTDADYEAATTTLVSNEIAVKKYEQAEEYSYYGQNAQDYEDLIDAGITAEHLTSGGLFYLRESDRRLTGTIRYQVGTKEPQTAQFLMADLGDFSRNHTWIVYAYYDSSTRLEVITVYVKDWDDADFDWSVYNW